jgi:hypothetical protein
MRDTGAVFIVKPSIESERPEIEFGLEFNKRNDWLRVGQVLRGQRDEAEYPKVLILALHPQATAWDFYFSGSVFGLMSERAVDLLEPFAANYFKFFQAWLNGASYFFLKSKRTLDCLDRDESHLVPFPSNPSRIMEIKRYRFHKNRIDDPLLFSIPEIPELFATPTVEAIMREEGLRGFQFVNAEQFG